MPIQKWNLTLFQLTIYFEGRLDAALDLRLATGYHIATGGRFRFYACGAGSTTDASGQQAKRVSLLSLTQKFEGPLKKSRLTVNTVPSFSQGNQHVTQV